MERWLDKVSSSLLPVINLKKEVHVSIKKIKIKTRRDSKNRRDTRAKERVDKLI
jgi:hypothetical protein